MKALVVKTTGLWYEVLAEGERKVARLRGKFKLENKKVTNPIAVGDWVDIDQLDKEDEFVIVNIHPRSNYIARQSPRKKGHDHLIASNVDQAVIFFTFHTPRTSIGFVDRILVTLEAFRIPGMIILNKTDLYSEEELNQWQAIAGVYEKLGYKTSSTQLPDESEKLIEEFSGKSSLLVGHSGTGKSTLINSLVPDADLAVNQISNFSKKGVHTTTFAEMHFLDENSKLIDTPGIKELGLSDIGADELAHYFPEMREFLGQCKYHNCQHTEEPGCLIKQKVEDGEIAFFRYESYLSMLFSEDNRR